MRSGGLLQREIERAGIPTVSISNFPETTEKVCVPRAAFIQFPFGRLLGDVGDREMQRRVCDHLVKLLVSAGGPNAYEHLPYEWPEPPEKTKWHPDVPAPIALHRKKLQAEGKDPGALILQAMREGERED